LLSQERSHGYSNRSRSTGDHLIFSVFFSHVCLSGKLIARTQSRALTSGAIDARVRAVFFASDGRVVARCDFHSALAGARDRFAMTNGTPSTPHLNFD
jgi:hypothetical protein